MSAPVPTLQLAVWGCLVSSEPPRDFSDEGEHVLGQKLSQCLVLYWASFWKSQWRSVPVIFFFSICNMNFCCWQVKAKSKSHGEYLVCCEQNVYKSCLSSVAHTLSSFFSPFLSFAGLLKSIKHTISWELCSHRELTFLDAERQENFVSLTTGAARKCSQHLLPLHRLTIIISFGQTHSKNKY